MKIGKRFFLILILFIAVNNSIWVFYTITPNNEKRELDNDSLNKIIQNSGTLHLPIKQIKKEILIHGDTDRYDELYMNLDYLGLHDEKLFWSLIMANKYNYARAYYDVFESIAWSNYYENYTNDANIHFTNIRVDSVEYCSLEHVDKKTRDFAIRYLVEASERNVQQAKYDLGIYYLVGVYFPKNVELGKKLIEESRR